MNNPEQEARKRETHPFIGPLKIQENVSIRITSFLPKFVKSEQKMAVLSSIIGEEGGGGAVNTLNFSCESPLSKSNLLFQNTGMQIALQSPKI